MIKAIDINLLKKISEASPEEREAFPHLLALEKDMIDRAREGKRIAYICFLRLSENFEGFPKHPSSVSKPYGSGYHKHIGKIKNLGEYHQYLKGWAKIIYGWLIENGFSVKLVQESPDKKEIFTEAIHMEISW